MSRSHAPATDPNVPREDRAAFVTENAVAVAGQLEAQIDRQRRELRKVYHALEALRHERGALRRLANEQEGVIAAMTGDAVRRNEELDRLDGEVMALKQKLAAADKLAVALSQMCRPPGRD
jgi:uncharacterized coiled-coil protein SlyX